MIDPTKKHSGMNLYDTKTSSQKHFIFWFAFFFLALAVPASLPLILLLAAMLAVVRSLWAAQALVISWLVSFINPGLVGTIPNLFFLKFFILLMVCIRAVVLLFRHKTIPGSHLALIAFGVVMCLLSGTSQLPSLSFLKALLFTLGLFGTLTVVRFIPNPSFFLHWLQIMGAVIVVVSLPLIAGGSGYLRNGTGFQGVLNHPQAFGMFMSLFGTWIAVDLFFSPRPVLSRPVLWTLLILSLGFLFMSEARVALLSAVLSFGFVGIFLSKGGKGMLYFGLAIGAVLTMFFFFDAPKELVSEFLLKRRSNLSGLIELYWNSRGDILVKSIDNFGSHLTFGIGFGVPSDLSSVEIIYDTTLGVPISAPIEKGFFLIALLEETGVVGSVIFLTGLVALLVRSFTAAPAPISALALTSLLLNTTENTLFSMSGFGLFIWIVLALPSMWRIP
jgi:hypothetical protein